MAHCIEFLFFSAVLLTKAWAASGRPLAASPTYAHSISFNLRRCKDAGVLTVRRLGHPEANAKKGQAPHLAKLLHPSWRLGAQPGGA